MMGKIETYLLTIWICKPKQVGTLGWKCLKLFLLAGDKIKEIGYVLEFELFLLAGDKTNEIG